MQYTQQQREYLHKRPANIAQYETVEFSHPDFGSVYLVADQVLTKYFNVSGIDTAFTPVSMSIPSDTNQKTDSSNAGTIQFARVGMQFRAKLKAITPSGALKPITATIRVYQTDVINPVYERQLFVAGNGININEEAVTVKLSFDNPAKVTKQKYFYDPSIFIGLQNG